MTLDKLFNNTRQFLKRATTNYITASLLLFIPMSCGNSNKVDEVYFRDNMEEMDQNSGIEYDENQSEFDSILLEAENVTDSNCSSHYQLSCKENNVYWKDSCEKLEGMFKECAQNEYCQDGECKSKDVDAWTDYLETEPVLEVVGDNLETVCSPDCWYKNCGSDGCGGSCGSCFPGYTCDNGDCVNY